MSRSYELSIVTKKYIEEFYCILDRMIKNMTEAELSNSVSYNFIAQMIPHHRAAIEMSENILKYTTLIPLQQIASQIINEQTKSIKNMLDIKCGCSSLENSQQDLCTYQNHLDQIMQTMFCEMDNARTTNEINCDFMWEMIPHHMGAVRMAETTLQYCICPELTPILEAIIASQKKGIRQMRQLQRCICCR